LIQLRDTGQAALEGWEHVFFQEGDLLFSIGLIQPETPQGLATMPHQNFLNGMEG
jgi:hypothetical protein